MTININNLETIEIPLSQLFAWEGNVRTADTEEPEDEDIDELAASIASVGLLSTPVVKKAQRRKYAVIGGNRRLKALNKLVEQLTTQRQNWLAQFPSTAAELWPWCLAQTQDRLLELLAFCASAIVDGVVSPHQDTSDAAKVEHADQLAAALQMDMRNWFTPTANNFFGRVSKHQIADVLTEAGRPLGLQELKTKKGELASIAAKEIKGTGWLPKPLRVKSLEVATEAKA